MENKPSQEGSKENIIHKSLGIIFQMLGRGILTRFIIKNWVFHKLLISAMANHSVIVLFVTSWVVAGLSYGALYLEVTINPVEIWAAPESRSRLEKDFFDQNFDPFYRTEQIFIKAVGIPNVCNMFSIILSYYFYLILD